MDLNVSKELVLRMVQLVANLKITPADAEDSIQLLKLEADSIFRQIEKENKE